MHPIIVLLPTAQAISTYPIIVLLPTAQAISTYPIIFLLLTAQLNVPEEFSPPKKLLLASQLKHTDEFIEEDGVTQIAYVVTFNSGLLRSKCIESSANYDSCIDLNLLDRHIFSPDQWWANHTLLLDALRDFGKLFGFCPVVKHNNLQCNRYRKKEYSCSCYQSGQLKRECTFNLNSLTAMVTYMRPLF